MRKRKRSRRREPTRLMIVAVPLAAGTTESEAEETEEVLRELLGDFASVMREQTGRSPFGGEPSATVEPVVGVRTLH